MVGDAESIVIYGKRDDEYWQECSVAAIGELRELQTSRTPTYGRTVKAGWSGGSVYFGIRCDETPGEKLNVTATKKEDSAIWYGVSSNCLSPQTCIRTTRSTRPGRWSTTIAE